MASPQKHTNLILVSMVLITMLGTLIAIQSKPGKTPNPKISAIKKVVEEDPFAADVKDGIHLPTGLIADEHYELVIGNCISCHSASLITANRMTADRWLSTIKWMQETQKLWDLGPNTDKIVAYLAKNYAPTETGRRKNLELQVSDWYVLEE
jgi:hypothetical protein